MQYPLMPYLRPMKRTYFIAGPNGLTANLLLKYYDCYFYIYDFTCSSIFPQKIKYIIQKES